MKYIIMLDDLGRRLPIIFPDVLTHAVVAEAIKDVIPGGAEPISAGFISLHGQSCRGGSDTLKLTSRPIDVAIIGVGEQAGAMPDYFIQALWDKVR